MSQDADPMTVMTENDPMWPKTSTRREAERAKEAWIAMYHRYGESGNIRLLDKTIELLREARDLQHTDNPDRADSCSALGNLLYKLYEEIGEVALLGEVVEFEREGVALRPLGHRDRASACSNLAVSLDLCYKRTGDLALLDEAIELKREALALQPPGHPDRSHSCAALAISLHARYETTGDLVLLDEAIKLQREALALQPPDHPDRPHSCANLAVSLNLRYKRTGDLALLDEAIKLQREALTLRPPGHPNRSNSCVGLAASLSFLYYQTSNIALLNEAIKLEREALALQPPGHPDRSHSCAALAISLQARYETTGDLVLLDEAIKLQREALALQPPGHPDRSNSCDALTFSLHARYRQTGDIALLNEEVELGREALALRPPGHPVRANSCVSLAVSLHARCEQTGDLALLDEAIKLKREALALRPPGHPDRSHSCISLAASLHARYEQTGDLALLDEEVELEQEALALRPPGHLDRSNSCVSLAASLHVRYEQTGDLTLLDEAIKLKREALALRHPGHPGRANSCVSLAVSLDACHEQTGDLALLDEAIKLKREALALQPSGHPDRSHSCGNLAVSLCGRYQRTGEVAVLDEAFDLLSYASKHSPASKVWRSLTWLSALHLFPGSSHYSALKALQRLHQSFQHEVDQIHNFIYEVCHTNVMLIWDESGAWTPHITALLVNVYAEVVDRLPLMAGFVLNTPSRLKTLMPTRWVGSDAFVASLLAEQPATAVTLLDRARGVVWAQALHQRDPQMEGAPKELTLELEDLLRAIAMPTPADLAELSDLPQDLRHQQNVRIQTILREIRAKSGLSRFMLGSTYETLREAARHHPVVMLVAARDHAFALIIPNSSDASPDVMRLHVASHDLQSLANTAGRANLRYRAASTEHHSVKGSDQAIPHPELTEQERAMRNGNFAPDWSPLAILWRDVVKPVLMRLHLAKEKDPRRRSRLHWYTAGQFAPIPIHAAGIYTGIDQECCSDYVVSSYTPTLSTLLRARKGLQPIAKADATLLLVAAEHTADARLPPLSKVKVERRDICSVVENTGVQYAASSQSVSKTAEATAALPAANLVHIACHGLQHTSEPLKSAFHLSDDDVLSVSELMGLDLKGAFLAFLSACETAKGDHDQPDEAIHLAATMLFVGFKSVVATMWAMRDEDGPVVARAFYERLLEGETITADAVPYALDHAVRKLRESGAPVGSWATFIHVGA